jgi:hypothetical protein
VTSQNSDTGQLRATRNNARKHPSATRAATQDMTAQHLPGTGHAAPWQPLQGKRNCPDQARPCRHQDSEHAWDLVPTIRRQARSDRGNRYPEHPTLRVERARRGQGNPLVGAVTQSGDRSPKCPDLVHDRGGCQREHRCDLRVPGFQRVNLRTKPGPNSVLYVRTVKTASGAPAAQIARSSHQGSRDTSTSGRRMMTLSWRSRERPHASA